MINFSIISIFFVLNFVETNYLDLIKVIEQNIDESVNPCDNFYRHSCFYDPSDNNTETLRDYFLNIFNEDALNFDYPSNVSFLKNIKINDSQLTFLDFLQDFTQKDAISSISQDYYKSCVNQQHNKSQYILSSLFESFNNSKSEMEPLYNFYNLKFDLNCTRASKNLKLQLENVWMERMNKNGISQNFIDSVLTSLRAYHFYRKNQKVLNQTNELFDEIKEELVRQIEKTGWLNTSDSFDAFLNITHQVKFCDPAEEVIGDVDPSFVKANDIVENCTRNYKIESLKMLCYLKINLVNSPIPQNIFNALNFHPLITITVPMLHIMSLNIPMAFKYGIVGFTLGHEIGHSVVKSLIDPAFIPYFPENIKNCIQNQFNSTCHHFNEGVCETVDERFDENGSDIFGGQVAYKLFKRKYGNTTNDLVEGSKMTNEQLFFYGLNIILCERGNSVSHEGNPHHANVARTNGGFIQIPDFEEVFNCKKDDAMILSKTKQCFIFGENAGDEQ